MQRAYEGPSIVLQRGAQNDPELVAALQQDLRALGYASGGFDGVFGPETERALRSLQFDLLHNDGSSSAGDGVGPIRMVDFNVFEGSTAISTVTGVLEYRTAACISALVSNEAVPKLPKSSQASVDNQFARRALMETVGNMAPGPFLAAIAQQESNGQQFRESFAGNDDGYLVIGLDRNDQQTPDKVTSRGYGIGQYTLFHHPPRQDEISDFILDARGNVSKMRSVLRCKFDSFVISKLDGADDRTAEHPLLPLRLCRYSSSDTRFMSDCKACAQATSKLTIQAGMPVYRNARLTYSTDSVYSSSSYSGVPNRADFLCDWPYAVRRYNGSGINSYHYQARVLLNLLSLVA